jgi:hypothetical protein
MVWRRTPIRSPRLHGNTRRNQEIVFRPLNAHGLRRLPGAWYAAASAQVNAVRARKHITYGPPLGSIGSGTKCFSRVEEKKNWVAPPFQGGIAAL